MTTNAPVPRGDAPPDAIADTPPPDAQAESAKATLGADRERRLHPWSWLFALLGSLRELALPLVALLFFGRSQDSSELFVLVGGAAVTLTAVLQYFTYRFRIDGDELIVRSGLLHRNVRNIPLHRIQNVVLKRNVLHRMFGVAEVRLESGATGAKAEAQMRVLSMSDAAALEALVRASGGRARSAGGATTPGLADATPSAEVQLLSLSTIELFKLGLTSNRGVLFAVAAYGVLSQLGGEVIGDSLQSGYGYAEGLGLGLAGWLIFAVFALALSLVVLRAISVLLVVLQFHGFRLTETARGLSVETGLLTRIRSNAPRRKIQHWTLHENFVHRLFGRRSLKVETAVLPTAREAGLTDIVPIDRPEHVDALIERWLPEIQWGRWDWHPLHPRAWRRMLVRPLALTLIVTAAAYYAVGAMGLLLLLLVPWWVFRAHQLAASCGYAFNERVLAWRSGWLDRHVSFAEISKLQALALVQSPFDRRHGMATLVADTAGANARGHRLKLRYLPVEIAASLFEELGGRIENSSLRW